MRSGAALLRQRRVRTALVNAAYIFAAIGLGLVVPQISVGATVESRRVTELLVAVGAAFVPFIAIIYSLLFLVVQFSSTAFTPRLNFFRDSPIVWHAFSFFTSVIVFAFTAASRSARTRRLLSWSPSSPRSSCWSPSPCSGASRPAPSRRSSSRRHCRPWLGAAPRSSTTSTPIT